ncbi:MAG: tRNA dimethylallyltransferase, partial [Clostridia bacterium]|nr:tRNA dimethylallyltransferase [Clostridia bacterium]
ELRALAQREGGERLLAMLAPLDAQTAARLHPNDTGRIIRAIELCSTTGTTMAQIAADSHAQPPQYRLCMIGLGCEPRGKLYARIDARVDRMLAQGLREEVRALLESGVRPDATSMQAIGYKELVGCLEGRETLGEAAETIKRETRRYAKRQLTWFRRDARIHWIDIFSLSDDKIYQNACETIEKYGFVCYNTSEPPEKPGSAAQWNE